MIFNHNHDPHDHPDFKHPPIAEMVNHHGLPNPIMHKPPYTNHHLLLHQNNDADRHHSFIANVNEIADNMYDMLSFMYELPNYYAIYSDVVQKHSDINEWYAKLESISDVVNEERLQEVVDTLNERIDTNRDAIGVMDLLETTNKDSVVNAINELKDNMDDLSSNVNTKLERVDELEDLLEDEETAREQQDLLLSNSIASEMSARESADALLTSNYNNLNTALTTEIANRINNETNLQSLINTYGVRARVVDIVATKNDLNNRKTTDIEKDDVIIVLKDETRTGKQKYGITYYRWTGGVTPVWSYKGILISPEDIINIIIDALENTGPTDMYSEELFNALVQAITQMFTDDPLHPLNPDSPINELKEALLAYLKSIIDDEDSELRESIIDAVVATLLDDTEGGAGAALKNALVAAVVALLTDPNNVDGQALKNSIVEAVVSILLDPNSTSGNELKKAIIASLTASFTTDANLLGLFQAALGVPISLKANLVICVAENADAEQGISVGVDNPTYQQVADIAALDNPNEPVFTIDQRPKGAKTTTAAADSYLILVNWGKSWDRPFKSISRAVSFVTSLYNLNTRSATIQVAEGVYGPIGTCGSYATNTGSITITSKEKSRGALVLTAEEIALGVRISPTVDTVINGNTTTEYHYIESAPIPTSTYTVSTDEVTGETTYSISSSYNNNPKALNYFNNDGTWFSTHSYSKESYDADNPDHVTSWRGYAVIKDSSNNLRFRALATTVKTVVGTDGNSTVTTTYNSTDVLYNKVIISNLAIPYGSYKRKDGTTVTISNLTDAINNIEPDGGGASLSSVSEGTYTFTRMKFIMNIGPYTSRNQNYPHFCSASSYGVCTVAHCKFDFIDQPTAAMRSKHIGSIYPRLFSSTSQGRLVWANHNIVTTSVDLTDQLGGYVYLFFLEYGGALTIGTSSNDPLLERNMVSYIKGTYTRLICATVNCFIYNTGGGTWKNYFSTNLSSEGEYSIVPGSVAVNQAVYVNSSSTVDGFSTKIGNSNYPFTVHKYNNTSITATGASILTQVTSATDRTLVFVYCNSNSFCYVENGINNTGNLDSLTTTNKTNLVAAINELVTRLNALEA